MLAGGGLSFLNWAGKVAGASFAIPVAAALATRVKQAPLRIIAVYCVLGFLQSMALSLLSARGEHNLWLIHLFIPIQATMFLWALALWQTRERMRITVGMIVPLYLIVWIALTIRVESFDTFPRYVKIIEGLLIIAVAAYTLLTRLQHISGPVTSYPWFWVCSALVMYLSFGAIVNPVSSLLLPHAPDRVSFMSSVNAVLLIVCNLFFTRAMYAATVRAPADGAAAAA